MYMSLDEDDLSLAPLKALWYGRYHPALSSFWTTILGPINISISCLFIILAVQGILLSYTEDMFFIAECLQTCILMIHVIVILVVLRVHRTTLFNLLQQKSHFWKIKDFSGDVFKECSKIANATHKVFRYYYYLIIFVGISFDLQPLVTGSLPTVCHIPSGWFNYLTIILWYFSCVVGFVQPGADTLFSSLAISLIIQFKLLAFRFKKLNSSGNDSSTKLRKEIKYLVDYHNFLLKYCEELNATFRSVFLIQYLSSIASAAVSVFIFMQPGPWINRIKFMLYFLSVLMETSFYCMPSEFVTIMANLLGVSLYESRWFEIRNLQLKKSLSLIIARTQKATVFSAYELISMNLRTFMLICKTVFSFYTYLSSARKIEK